MSIISDVEGIFGHVVVTNPPPPAFAVSQAQGDPKSAEIGAGISAAKSITAAIPVVGPALGQAITSIGGLVLGQHTARLKGAINENSAIPAAVSEWDKDVHEIIAELTDAEISPEQAIAALTMVDQQVYGYLHSLVGQPGTSWSGTPGNAPCNKKCTAACCVYNNDLQPAIGQLIAAIQRGGGVVTVPKVYPPSNKSYGVFSREAYQLAVTVPSATAVAVGTIGQHVGITTLLIGVAAVVAVFVIRR